VFFETPSLTLFTGLIAVCRSLVAAEVPTRRSALDEVDGSADELSRYKSLVRRQDVTSLVDQVDQRKRYICNIQAQPRCYNELYRHYSPNVC